MMMSDVDERGPYDMLNRIRNFIGVEFDELSQPYGKNEFANMWICYFCNSIWIGITFATIMYFNPLVAFYLAFPFAISGSIVLIEKHI